MTEASKRMIRALEAAEEALVKQSPKIAAGFALAKVLLGETLPALEEEIRKELRSHPE